MRATTVSLTLTAVLAAGCADTLGSVGSTIFHRVPALCCTHVVR